MLIPNAAAVYVNDEVEWKALMAFLKSNDCLVGDMRTDPEKCMYSCIHNAIRIYNDRFWKAAHHTYLETGPDKYAADPAWWCVSGYEFIDRHQAVDEVADSIDDSILDEIL